MNSWERGRRPGTRRNKLCSKMRASTVSFQSSTSASPITICIIPTGETQTLKLHRPSAR